MKHSCLGPSMPLEHLLEGLWRADDLKPRITKVTIEGKCPANPEAAHHGKGDAIRKTDLRIRVLPHPADRFDVVLPRGGQHVNALGGVQIVNPVRGVAVTGYPSERRRQSV